MIKHIVLVLFMSASVCSAIELRDGRPISLDEEQSSEQAELTLATATHLRFTYSKTKRCLGDYLDNEIYYFAWMDHLMGTTFITDRDIDRTNRWTAVEVFDLSQTPIPLTSVLNLEIVDVDEFYSDTLLSKSYALDFDENGVMKIHEYLERYLGYRQCHISLTLELLELDESEKINLRERK